MRKIFLTTVSCIALTSSYAFAMIEEKPDNKLAIVHKQPVALEPITADELRQYIYKGLEGDGLEITINGFDDFAEGLSDTVFTKEKKSIADIQNRKKIFEQLQNNYIKSVCCFQLAFDNNLRTDAKILLPNSATEKTMHTEDHIRNYPYHEPYFRAFQNLSHQFLAIRESCLGVSLVSDFEILESTQNVKHRAFLFKDKGEYVPLPFSVKDSYLNVPLLYGSQLLPRKQFIFHKGALVQDSGIFINPTFGYLKVSTQYGKAAANPFTTDRMTYNLSYDNEVPLMGVLKAHFGIEEFTKKSHYITLPTTQEEHDILELLFLEDLLEGKNRNIKNVNELILLSDSSQKFLMQIETELKEDTEETGEKTIIEARIEELEEKIINASQAITQSNSQASQVINNTNNNNDQPKKKKKMKGTPNKNQKKQTNKVSQKQQKNQSSSNKDLENEKKKQARELLSKVKQEGRVKYREILGVMNTVRSSTKNEEIFNKFATIGRKGSHINFHLEDGEGLSLVKKHGKQDVTYSANQVNYFSRRLINAMFSLPDK